MKTEPQCRLSVDTWRRCYSTGELVCWYLS